jgi:hypothetical protein
MANQTTFTNTSVERIKRQSVSLEKSATKVLVDVLCFEIDINDYLVKNPDGSIREEVSTYTKQKPGGEEYEATVVKRFFKGYPYANGTLFACNEKGEILLDDNGEPIERMEIKGSRKDDELYGEYSFLVQNDKAKADLYIEKFYENTDDTNLVVKHHVYIEVYETTYQDKEGKSRTALTCQTKVEFINDNKSINTANKLNKMLAEAENFRSTFGLYPEGYAKKADNDTIKIFTSKDLL